jgi:hypothetical protein
MVSKGRISSGSAPRIIWVTTDLFMNQVVPQYVLVSIRSCDLLGIGKKSMVVDIHSIADTEFGFWVMNYFVNLGFFDLLFGPIWETRLRIPLPATLATFRTMVTVLWDRRCDTFELILVDTCEPVISTND